MPTPTSLDPNTVRRRIQFFRVWIASNAENVPRRLDPAPLCNTVREIHESADRYWTDRDETETTSWLHDPTHDDRLILATIKRKDLPLIEEDGVSERLELAVGKGIAEAIHVRFFANNVVGAEYNDRGPRLPRLKYFLGSKRAETYRAMQIVPLLDEDTRGRLAGLRNVSLVEFTIARPTLEGVGDNGHYMQDLRNLFDVAEAGVLEISMRPKKQGEKLDTPAARAFVETMLDNQQTASALSKMAVRGSTQLSRRRQPSTYWGIASLTISGFCG